ncbi:MAG: hypothetical protein KGV44_12415 [Flavobacteriaceae bacterium]|nr:hypothetical protein [Flavobacteriaceae bacterium]MBS9768322.1 hypothetical protein [Flavobacteriaceae bacterium]
MGTTRRTARTSVLSWRECLKEGLPLTEKQEVCEYLTTNSQRAYSSRQLSRFMGKERTNLTRTLNSLVAEGIVEVAKHERCETTGRLVGFYAMKKGTN